MEQLISRSGARWTRTEYRFCGRWVWEERGSALWAILSEEGEPVALTWLQAEEECYRAEERG